MGQSVPIPQNSRVTDDGQVINSLTYENVGIILNVTPHINPTGLVTLIVDSEVSSLSGETVAITQGLGAPIIDTRDAENQVAILDGQTIVIGGMMQDQKTQEVQKVPLLGDIPLLGLLFQRNTTDKTKTELLFFLTPHVARCPAYLKAMSKDEVKGLKLTPNAVSPGMFQDYMRDMQRGGTTQPTTEPTAEPTHELTPSRPPSRPTSRPRINPRHRFNKRRESNGKFTIRFRFGFCALVIDLRVSGSDRVDAA